MLLKIFFMIDLTIFGNALFHDMNTIENLNSNGVTGDHVFLYPSRMKNDEDTFLQETTIVPIRDNSWITSLFSSSLKHSYSYNMYFKPESEDSLLEIVKTIAMYLAPRARYWFPTLLLEWPSTLLYSEKDEIDWRIRTILIERVAPLTNNCFEINQNIYFIFKTIGNESSEAEKMIPEMWELYNINGFSHNESREVLVVQEVSLETWDYGRNSRRGDMRMITFAVGAPNKEDTHVELAWKDTPDGGRELVGGISLEILKDLEDSLHFKSMIVEADWMSQFPNGTLKGVTADLFSRREFDLYIGQTVPIARRAEIMDYIQPTSRNMLRAFVHQPPASSFRNIYTTPFNFRLWLAIGVCWFLILLCARLASKTLSFQRPPSNLDSEDSILNLDAFIWMVGSATQQGWYRSPRSMSLRGIFITASLTGLVCYIAFAAQIVSVLSLENVPIQSLSDLFSSSLPIYVVTESITITEIMKGLQTEVEEITFHNVPKSIGVHFTFQFPCGLLIYSHRFHEERQKQGFPNYLTCDVVYSFPVTKVPLPSAMAMQKDAPLREFFNHRILIMRERGFLHRYMVTRIVASGLDCLQVNTRYRKELGLHDILTPVIILMFGYMFCFLFFIFEHVYLQRKKRLYQKLCLLYYRK